MAIEALGSLFAPLSPQISHTLPLPGFAPRAAAARQSSRGFQFWQGLGRDHNPQTKIQVILNPVQLQTPRCELSLEEGTSSSAATARRIRGQHLTPHPPRPGQPRQCRTPERGRETAMELLHRGLSSAELLLWPLKYLQSDTKFKPEAANPAVSLCSPAKPSARLSFSGRASTEIKNSPKKIHGEHLRPGPHKPQSHCLGSQGCAFLGPASFLEPNCLQL